MLTCKDLFSHGESEDFHSESGDFTAPLAVPNLAWISFLTEFPYWISFYTFNYNRMFLSPAL